MNKLIKLIKIIVNYLNPVPILRSKYNKLIYITNKQSMIQSLVNFEPTVPGPGKPGDLKKFLFHC